MRAIENIATFVRHQTLDILGGANYNSVTLTRRDKMTNYNNREGEIIKVTKLNNTQSLIEKFSASGWIYTDLIIKTEKVDKYMDDFHWDYIETVN
jgi:hypothetical protein